ncbi:DNA mismatch repair endonuclease MutL [Desulfosporosinus sp. PR]|uniref:DNA mismatch repair endonuclease MutL n=1 Tax=Candidatus Desulfosporosinus nitrosoreducens TaxID=3401928 RepID=UPI0027EDDD1B|nr:DNA mismatch repair endonuclease MutL [Desulfosporosinus sp. PR]MDQ7092721.1 DNA mismatch repair endonuclease MutL [Desulfosporosinus sp. PR]
MSSVIHILDSHSANQIAAGEVVERPVSVVKELVENALDAGAKHIDIAIEENGVPLIRVRDDGRGMGAEDLPLAVLRHATSKITRIQDLDHLQTLGFRGEALASIASVSTLEITSRPSAEISGLTFTLTGGEPGLLQEVGCPSGTSVTVRNLFFNTPARLKFLKSKATEFGLISDTVGRLALAHPQIAFSLAHPAQVVLQTSGRGDLKETMGAVFGQGIARQLIALDVQNQDWRLTGLISPPELVRTTKQAQTFMINGRVVRSSFLSNAVEEGYRTLIPVKFHPIVALHLYGPPSDYDVNVHPTKMDVKFKNESDLSSFISRTIYQTLLKSKPLPSFHSHSEPALRPKPDTSAPFNPSYDPPVSSEGVKAGEVLREIKNDGEFLLPQISPETGENKRTEPLTKEPVPINEVKGSNQQINLFQGHPATQKSRDNSAEVPNPGKQEERVFTETENEGESKDILSSFWPIGQLFNTYILATDGNVLLLIDQHAAHERINYERILSEFQQRKQASQALLIPTPMEFTLQEEQVLLEYLWILSEMGFVLEQFGSQTYLLRGVPVQTGNFPADQLLRQFIEEVLQKNATPSYDKLLKEWIYLLACKESIRAQDSLTLLEMEQLISRLRQTENPYTCPHGRPTTIKITRAELEKRFYRVL